MLSTKPIQYKKRRKVNKKDIWDKVNVPKIICLHMIGESHNETHRMGVGVIVMTCGVMVAHATAHIFIIEYIGDIIGYCIHAIGGIPFVEHLIAKVKKEERGSKETLFMDNEEKEKLS